MEKNTRGRFFNVCFVPPNLQGLGLASGTALNQNLVIVNEI